MPKDENPLEVMVEKLSEDLVRTVEAMPEQEKPFGAVELTPDEQFHEYMLIRDNPQAFVGLIEEHGMRDAVAYVQEMERRIEHARPGDVGG